MVGDNYLNIATEQKVHPANMKVDNISRIRQVMVRWIVDVGGKYTIKVDSKKGGIVNVSK
nr:hypothetical protein [Pseudopedobacter sp.]